MLEFLGRLLGMESNSGAANSSKNVAKERLRLVLVHDRASVAPELLQSLKEDLIEVISKYMEIDKEALEVHLNSEDDTMALVANIPVVKMNRTVK